MCPGFRKDREAALAHRGAAVRRVSLGEGLEDARTERQRAAAAVVGRRCEHLQRGHE